jgi:hypothetical protein
VENIMPTLADRNKTVDPWECPVLLRNARVIHNARVIQNELNAVLQRAHRAGVQVEFHRSENGTTVEAVCLQTPTDDDENGVFIVASPDPDLEPEIVL